MKKHAVRIVGGVYRKTPIPVTDAPGLRPTPDRVRETLFNWLAHFWGGDFSGRHVLDLFAGTGALGFEAASRGVELVQMAESNPAAVKALNMLRDKLDARHVRIHAGDARVMLARLGGATFDLVALDPPFNEGWIDRLWGRLPALLKPDGLVYIEAESALAPPAEWELLRQGHAGQVWFHLLRFAATQKTDNNSNQAGDHAKAGILQSGGHHGDNPF